MPTTARTRITEIDLEAMAFVARFPGADTKALSQVLLTQASNLPNKKPAGKHPTNSAITKRLTKLENIGCVQSWRNPASGITHWGILETGIDALSIFGQAPALYKGINGKRGSALVHSRNIAYVAALLLHGEYADARVNETVGSVTLDRFIPDALMQSSVTTLRKHNPNSSLYLHNKQVLAEAPSNHLEDPMFWITQPELLVFSAPADANTEHLSHRPDLVVLGDKQRVAIEVELNVKPISAYEDIMRLYVHNLLSFEDANEQTVQPVEHLIYLCANQSIKNAVIKAANSVHAELIPDGFLIVADLTDADGKPLTHDYTVPAAPRVMTAPTVSAPTGVPTVQRPAQNPFAPPPVQ